MNIVLHYPTYSQFNKKPKLYHSGGDPAQQWDPVLAGGAVNGWDPVHGWGPVQGWGLSFQPWQFVLSC